MLLDTNAPPLRIGLWLDALKLDVRAALKRIAPWGLDALALDGFGAEVNPRALTETGRRDLAHRFQAGGLRAAALRLDVGGRRLADPATLDTNLARIGEGFDLARDLGIARAWVPLGYVPAAGEPNAETIRRALSDALGALEAFSTRTGVRPVVPAGAEPAEELAAFLDARDPGRLFEVDLQPGRFVGRGSDPLDALSRLAARLGLASVYDAWRGGGEAPFGAGDVDWGPLIVGLSTAARADGLPLLAATSREGDRPALLLAAVERLKRLRANPLG
ncbi:MAG: hypothetical protein M5U26_23990 [Planctomycetota bacterium]|nr:hypothetical protein [Planctomycetota bacterium]